MSGDVQPRKRKDKRKKRDDRKSEGDVSLLRQPSFQDDDDSASHGVHITKMGNEDIHLHVQEHHGTGGHWCAKLIFFALMAVLLGLVGLIIMENRGLEDLDTPLSESRYSNYFDGWVDERRPDDEHDAHPSNEAALDDHDDEHDDEHDEEYEPHSDEEEAEEDHEEEEEEEEENNNAAENVTAEDDDDDEVEESLEPPQSAADDDQEEDDEDADEEDEDDDKTQSAPETAEYDDVDEEDEDADEDNEESIEPTVSQSEAQSAPETAEDDADEDDDDEEIEESAAAQSAPDAAAADDDDDDDFDQDDDDEDDFESLDQEAENEAFEEQLQAAADAKAKQQQDNAAEDNIEAVTTTSWFGSLAVKIGVGIALALVSRLVLIRKNPNTNDEDQPTPEAIMRRRLTIATAEDNIPDDGEELPPLDDEEYSEEEIEIEEEIEVEISDIEESDDNVALSASYVPETFEQLSAMYRSTTEPKATESKAKTKPEPAKEPEPEQEEEEEDLEPQPQPEPTAAMDIYIEYEDGDIEDYEHDDETDDELISDEEEDEISDVDDAELMSRLEAKYGRLPAKEYDTDPDSDDPSWTQIKPKEPTGAKVAEDDSDLFEQELRKANAEMIKENYANALREFNTLTHTYAHLPAAHLQRAQALERMAERQRSNRLLLDAIESYKRYLAFAELIANHTEYRLAGERCIQQLRFLGHTQQAVAIHEQLIERFPTEAQLRNQLSLTHLMSNNLVKLQQVAAETLKLHPRNPVASLHFGLALKQLGGNYAQALPHLQHAIDSEAAGTQEPYFYLALGETLQRLGKQAQALQIYQRGAQKRFYASVYQRSLYNVPQLRAQPFWQPAETGYALELAQLQRSWRDIRKEAMSLLSSQGNFQQEAEQLRDTGNWQQYELYARGQRLERNCQRAPITCALLERFTAASGCRRGQIKFSAMQAQTHVWPHCGPTNCRLRAHLTLVAPQPHLTSLRVAEHQRTWREGDLFIFDDSFEHEVWHNGTQWRLVLIIDFWHPDLSAAQRRSLTPI